MLDAWGRARRGASSAAGSATRGVADPRGPQPATRANPAGLTGRQVDVLELLAEGLTNAEIAARLVVSTRTVDHHVSAILTRLGLSSRREVARIATRLDDRSHHL